MRASSTPAVRRTCISNAQRRSLRQWFQQRAGRARHIDAIDWFEKEYGYRVRQSTVSESLSERYTYLDLNQPQAESVNASSLSAFRQRAPQWPILEQILFQWQQLTGERGGQVSGDILLQKAAEIWPQIPQYSDQKPPEFSQGWPANFKRRHNIKRRVQYGEAQGAYTEKIEEEMRAVQTLCGEYHEDEIYNMDETGLFWRRAPDAGLTASHRPGVKKEKARVSVVCCANYTSTHKLPLWIIGHAKVPRALKNLNFSALNCSWQSNTKAWTTTFVMIAWLEMFYAHVGSSKPILLFMDNFSAHYAGVEARPPPPNIKIQWLPANSTSRFQPLDQGIIATTKAYYKKHWLQFMIDQYEKALDPIKTTNLYLAVRWLQQAWFDELSPSTIYHCFRKAQLLLDQPPINLPQTPAPDLRSLYQEANRAGQIQEAMSLENFLNPADDNKPPHEDSVVSEDQELLDIITQHTGVSGEIGSEEQAIEDEAIEMRPLPTAPQALEALETLIYWQQHQQLTTSDDIRHLSKLERFLHVHRLDANYVVILIRKSCT